MARVLSIHLRPSSGAATVEVEEAIALEGRGLDGDHARGGSRQVTLLAVEEWRAACAEVASQADPSGRRANLVCEGIALEDTVGRRLRIGRMVLEVAGFTLPCTNMGRVAPGLRRALEPKGRGGVHGRILRGGPVSRGDPVEILGPDEE